MADLKISELPASDALTGAELVELVQGGVNKRTTTQDIADLGGGGGTVESVTGDGVDNTDPENPVLSFPTPSDIGLGNVDNTSDANKPISTATQMALNLKSDILSTFRTLTSDHTLDSTDLASVNAGDVLEIQMNVAIANSVTIPANATQAFPVGSNIIVSQIGAGQTSIVAAVGVTINSANGWVKIAYQYASVVLTKTATNTWSIKGTLAA